MIRSLVVVGTLAVVVATAAAIASAWTPTTSRCFGAPSRAMPPCRDARLAKAVVPTPSQAVAARNAPCTLRRGLPMICEFGVTSAPIVDDIVLIGDSHATHWRGAH